MDSGTPNISSCVVSSPVGLLQLKVENSALSEISFLNDEGGDIQETEHSILKRAETQLREYFDGSRTAFNLPIQPVGTDFQRRVWQAVQEIPFGQTATYRELAEKLGNVNSIRAVGGANGQNPLPIVIPCHRIVGADGNLVGYSGGIRRKEWLLKHEGALLI